MTNKEYKQAAAAAESAAEIYTFESWNSNGFWTYPNRYMKSDDLKEIRQAYKEIKKGNQAFTLEDFNGRALIIPTESGYILRSYYTDVAEIRNGNFIKLWAGYSVTTLKHINEFRRFLGMTTLSKREWIEL